MSHAGGQSDGRIGWACPHCRIGCLECYCAPIPAPRWRPCTTLPSREGLHCVRFHETLKEPDAKVSFFRGKWTVPTDDRSFHGIISERCEWLDDQGAAQEKVEPARATGGVNSLLHSSPAAAHPLGTRALEKGGDAHVPTSTFDDLTGAAHPSPRGERELEAAMAFRPDGKLFGSRSSE